MTLKCILFKISRQIKRNRINIDRLYPTYPRRIIIYIIQDLIRKSTSEIVINVMLIELMYEL